jgi:hypothetical protein
MSRQQRKHEGHQGQQSDICQRITIVRKGPSLLWEFDVMTAGRWLPW